MRGRSGRRAGAVLFFFTAGLTAHAAAQEVFNLRGSVGENVLQETRGGSSGSTEQAQSVSGVNPPQYRPYSQGAAAGASSADPVFELPDPTAEIAATEPPAGEKSALEIPEPQARQLPVGSIEPVQGGERRSDSDPYAATGIAVGSFTLRPSVEFGLTYNRETGMSGTPAAAAETVGDSAIGEGALRLNLASDWERHSLAIDAYGRLQRAIDGTDDLEPQIAINAEGAFEIGADTRVTAQAGYSYELDDPQSAAFFAATDPSLIPPVTGTNEPETQTLDGSLALRQDFGKVFGEIGVAAERTVYGAASLSDGTVLSQGDLDNTVYDARLRAGFELSPVFSPFIEVGYGIRRMDEIPDSGGVDRNAARYALRAGSAIDFGEKLNGEVALGYLREDIADPSLSDIGGLSADATVNWSPRRETDVALRLATTTEASGAAGESGALMYSADLAVTHRIRANLTAEALAGIDFRDVRGGVDETTYVAQAGLTYWFNRFAGITTRLRHEQTTSSDVLDRSKTTSAFIGLRLQR